MKSTFFRAHFLMFTLTLGCSSQSNNDAATTLSECATYCQQVKEHCADQADVDTGTTTCPTTCGRFPTSGKDGDTSGDSVQCRVYHSGAPAASDPNLHCPHAGVSGDDMCGTWCDVYCREALNNCSGSLALYHDLASCQSACTGLATTGRPGDTSGNTVQCRIYHLNAAAMDPNTHCPHGLVNSAVCK